MLYLWVAKVAWNVYTEGMAEQISKIFVPHLETITLVVFYAI